MFVRAYLYVPPIDRDYPSRRACVALSIAQSVRFAKFLRQQLPGVVDESVSFCVLSDRQQPDRLARGGCESRADGARDDAVLLPF